MSCECLLNFVNIYIYIIRGASHLWVMFHLPTVASHVWAFSILIIMVGPLMFPWITSCFPLARFSNLLDSRFARFLSTAAEKPWVVWLLAVCPGVLARVWQNATHSLLHLRRKKFLSCSFTFCWVRNLFQGYWIFWQFLIAGMMFQS